jgi:hypothetical protein
MEDRGMERIKEMEWIKISEGISLKVYPATTVNGRSYPAHVVICNLLLMADELTALLPHLQRAEAEGRIAASVTARFGKKEEANE